MVDYRWRATKTIDFIQKFYLYLTMKDRLTYHLSNCLSWSFVLMRFYTLNWETKIWIRAISNIHAGRRFPIPALEFYALHHGSMYWITLKSGALVTTRNPSTHLHVAEVWCRPTADSRTALVTQLKLAFHFGFF